jgi:penicillin-binding protein 1C
MMLKWINFFKTKWDDFQIKKSFHFAFHFIKQKFQKQPFRYSIISIGVVYFFFFLLPRPLFDSDYSSLLYSSEGELLNAHIAEDEQWRFPKSDSITPKIETCLLHFEDEYFYYHWGINPISFIKALKLNLKKGKN